MWIPSIADMVLACTDRLRGQNSIEIHIRAARPLLHRGEHVVVELGARIAEGGMVEDFLDVGVDLRKRHIGVLPSIQNARCDEGKDRACHGACGRIEDVAEVVLGQ
jgi:hypothetical protein